jgi:hypothetical protein
MSSDKEEEKKKVARDFINLTHVETHKQKINPTDLAGVLNIKKEYDTHHQADLALDTLSNDDKVILAAFEKKRMLTERIWIIVNQSRVQINLLPIKLEDLKHKLTQLTEMGYLLHEQIPYEKSTNDVYILTEKGIEYNQ